MLDGAETSSGRRTRQRISSIQNYVSFVNDDYAPPLNYDKSSDRFPVSECCVVSLSVVAEQTVPNSVFAIAVGHGGHVDHQDGIGQQQVDRRCSQPSTATSMRSVATALAELCIFMSVMHFNFPATQNIHTKIKTKTCEADCDKEGFERRFRFRTRIKVIKVSVTVIVRHGVGSRHVVSSGKPVSH